MTSSSRRIWALLPVSVLLASFAACTGDNPETITTSDAATSSSSSSSGDAPLGDSAPSDGSGSSGSSGGSSSSSGGERADAALDSGPLCTQAPTVGARIVASCVVNLQLLFGGLPPASNYELARVTGTGNGNCAGNPVMDKPWKGSATIVNTSDTEREVHLRLLPPTAAGGDGAAEFEYHFSLTTSDDDGNQMHALCNSPLPVYVEPDAGDPTTANASFGQNVDDAGLPHFAIKMQTVPGPQPSPGAVFRFDAVP